MSNVHNAIVPYIFNLKVNFILAFALSNFGPAGAVGGVWECPDLTELRVEGESGQKRWVLSVNLNPGVVAGGSGDQYFVGRFDGKRFIDDNPSAQVLWADYGKDFYASTSFSDMVSSDGGSIWIGWLDNWDYAARVPTRPWRGAQSIPRILALRRFPEGIRLVQEPVAELQALRGRHVAIRNQSVEAANRILQSKGVKGDTLEIEIEFEPGHATEFGFRARKGPSEETVVGVDLQKSQLFVDRTRSGVSRFDPEFPGRQTAPIGFLRGQRVKLHIFVDRSSVEVFGNDGETVISDLIFPSSASQAIELYSKGAKGHVVELDIWNLNSAWDALVRSTQ